MAASAPQGPGWWQASDENWYPPELTPGTPSSGTSPAPQPTQQAGYQQPYSASPGYRQAASLASSGGYSPQVAIDLTAPQSVPTDQPGRLPRAGAGTGRPTLEELFDTSFRTRLGPRLLVPLFWAGVSLATVCAALVAWWGFSFGGVVGVVGGLVVALMVWLALVVVVRVGTELVQRLLGEDQV